MKTHQVRLYTLVMSYTLALFAPEPIVIVEAPYPQDTFENEEHLPLLIKVKNVQEKNEECEKKAWIIATCLHNNICLQNNSPCLSNSLERKSLSSRFKSCLATVSCCTTVSFMATYPFITYGCTTAGWPVLPLCLGLAALQSSVHCKVMRGGKNLSDYSLQDVTECQAQYANDCQAVKNCCTCSCLKNESEHT